MRSELELALGPGGALERAHAGYEHRPEQMRMAEMVAEALAGGRPLVVEAGTGTGKTLAYLVPALASGKKVVVSTATRALQDQIVDKDLPLLARLGFEFRAVAMKGRQNYLCLARKERFDRQPLFTHPADAALYREIEAWAERTESGDRAELELPEAYPAWREISSTSETCTGQKCPFYDECFVFDMRRKAQDAQLLVVNHHLFFADLALRTSRAGDAGASVIPGYEAVVFDEAHALEEIATEYFGIMVSNYRVDELVRDVGRVLAGRPDAPKEVHDAVDRVGHASDRFFRAMAELAPRGPSPRWRIARGDLRPATIHRTELEGALAHLGGECPDEDADFLGFRRRAADISVGLSLIAAAEQPDLVYWAESRGRGLFLRAAPVDIAQELRERLLDRTPGLVFTSATLAAAGSLEFFRTRIGLRGNEAAEAILPSSFDFEEQAALYLPRAVPDPNAPGFGEAAAREIRALCEITGGRAFALFTSYKAMEAAHARLKDDLPWPALLQGERPKQALLRDFKQRPSVLFATASFWEGVDVPGDALSLVIIDRLPFASPGDPLTSARIEHLNAQGFDAFNHYQLPQAALALKQGFGRLIRTRTDRGIVAVLDRRITTRSYGRAFLDTLPQCPRFDDRDALAAWWGKGLTSPAPPALPS